MSRSLEGDLRDHIAEILEAIARDGLPGPRDLDVALDAIGCSILDAEDRRNAAAAEAPCAEGVKVTHNDQLEIWSEELTFALMDWLKEPETYDDKVHMNSAMKAEIKSIVEAAFDLVTPNPHHRNT